MTIFHSIVGMITAATPVAIFACWANRQHQKSECLSRLHKQYWELMSTKVGKLGKPLADVLLHCEGKSPGRIPSIHRRQLISFFKEVDILIRAGMVDKKCAFDLFAQSAIQCDENEHFWNGLGEDSIYRERFRNFVENMRKMKQKREGRCVIWRI